MVNIIFYIISSFSLLQPTGMPLVLSWSFLPCHALLASSQESSHLPTFRPLRGSTAHLLLGSCSLFQVSQGYNQPNYVIFFFHHICHYYLICISIKFTTPAIETLPTEMNLTFMDIILICVTLCPICQLSLFCLQWPFTLEWLWTSWASALGTGASLGPTY